MRTSLYAITALLYAASIGVAVGIVGCIYTQRLELGAQTAVVGFAVAVAVFAYALWRFRRSRSAFLGRAYHNL